MEKKINDLLELIASIEAMVNACEMYKDLDAKSEMQQIQVESISYNTIKDKIKEWRKTYEN